MNKSRIAINTRTSFVSFSAMIAGMAVLFLVLLALLLVQVFHISGVYHPSWLLSLLNIVFISLVCFLASYLAARAFAATGQVQLAWFGGAVLVFGLANLCAAVVYSEPNLNVTVHNSGALLASMYALVGAFMASGWSSPPGTVRARFSTPIIMYILGAAFVLAIFLLAAWHVTPVFFVPGQGGSVLRDSIVRSATTLFAISGFFLLALYLRSRNQFLYWFSLGFLLIAVGLLAIGFQKTIGDSVNWVGRSAQYIAGIYLLIAIVVNVRASRIEGISFARVASTIFPASARSYRLLVDSATDAIIALNREGRIALWNASAERMFGYSAKEALGAFLIDLIVPPKYAGDVRQWIVGAQTVSSIASRELTLRHRDGREITAEASLSTEISSSALLKAFVVRDIGERKRAEEAIRQINYRLAVALDASMAGTWDWNIATGYIECSPKTFEILGLDPQKTVASFEVWQNATHPQDRDLARARISQALKEHATLVNEYRIVLPDGQVRWVNTLGRATYDYRGRPLRMTGISMDITERKKAEQLKDEFIGMVSHELRTPLTVVTGALYASMNKEVPDEEKQQLMQDALWGTEMLDQILDNLLELSRAQADRLRLNIKIVNIANVARSVMNRLEYKSAGHRFEIDIPPDMTVQADPVRIELVLRNLLDNAIKYSPSGGQIKAFASLEADKVVIGVSDQGYGISSEDQEKLFTRFHRLERPAHAGAEGIGLGLSVCRTLVEAHQGRIWVKSEPGRGSTFFFTIPANPRKSRSNAVG